MNPVLEGILDHLEKNQYVLIASENESKFGSCTNVNHRLLAITNNFSEAEDIFYKYVLDRLNQDIGRLCYMTKRNHLDNEIIQSVFNILKPLMKHQTDTTYLRPETRNGEPGEIIDISCIEESQCINIEHFRFKTFEELKRDGFEDCWRKISKIFFNELEIVRRNYDLYPITDGEGIELGQDDNGYKSSIVLNTRSGYNRKYKNSGVFNSFVLKVSFLNKFMKTSKIRMYIK